MSEASIRQSICLAAGIFVGSLVTLNILRYRQDKLNPESITTSSTTELLLRQHKDNINLPHKISQKSSLLKVLFTDWNLGLALCATEILSSAPSQRSSNADEAAEEKQIWIQMCESYIKEVEQAIEAARNTIAKLPENKLDKKNEWRTTLLRLVSMRDAFKELANIGKLKLKGGKRKREEL